MGLTFGFWDLDEHQKLQDFRTLYAIISTSQIHCNVLLSSFFIHLKLSILGFWSQELFFVSFFGIGLCLTGLFFPYVCSFWEFDRSLNSFSLLVWCFFCLCGCEDCFVAHTVFLLEFDEVALSNIQKWFYFYFVFFLCLAYLGPFILVSIFLGSKKSFECFLKFSIQ